MTIGGYPGQLRKLLGIWVEEIDALLPDMKNEIIVTEKSFGLDDSYECGLLCDLLHLEGAKALAVYGKDFYAGMPCITENSFGKGKAYYIATDPHEKLLYDFIGKLCSERGIKPPLDVPKGVEVTRRVKDRREFTFVLNHNDVAVDIDLKDGKYINLITCEEKAGNISLEPKGVLILEKI